MQQKEMFREEMRKTAEEIIKILSKRKVRLIDGLGILETVKLELTEFYKQKHMEEQINELRKQGLKFEIEYEKEEKPDTKGVS